MIIDAHGHVEEHPMAAWHTPAELVISLMDIAGIDLTLVTSFIEAPTNPDAIDSLAATVRKYPDRLLGFARINPNGGDKTIEAMEYAATFPEISGFKLHPISNGAKAYNKPAQRVLKRAGELGLPIFSHCCDRVAAQPLQIARGLLMQPEVVFICHMGGFFHGDDSILMAKKCPNVYLDTSSCPYPDLILKAIDILGADRIVFASDNPAGDPISDLAKITNLGLKKEDEELILYKNIARILGLKKVRGMAI
ncbi:MAG: amidohydrolase family protein [Defluviitaleaceae bacterium]|nr:amidohydrolase family protein [Defluviitaleaceae bacterium]